MKRNIFLILLFLLFASGCQKEAVYDIKDASEESTEAAGSEDIISSENGQEEKDAADDVICVYVCGEVASPGVYELQQGSRVYEAIDVAGGLLDGVDTTKINMAQLLSDGQQITVAPHGLQTGESVTSADGAGKVNLNTAGKEELMTLSGIGEARAEDILEYRQKYGSFSSIEDIMNISGIGEKMFEKIKDDIEV